MALDRRTTCPRCGESIRLTRNELADKRGFCALCDARFDLLPEMLVGEGPLRSFEMVQAADLTRPPTRRMQEIAAEGELPRYLLRQAGPRWPYAGMMAFFGFWMLGFVSSPMPVFGLLPGLIVLLIATFGLTAREEISFERGDLVLRRGPLGRVREKRVMLDGVDGFMVTSRRDSAPLFGPQRFRGGGAVVKALRAGDDPLRIGVGLGYEDEAMEWLARRLERALRLARSKDAGRR